ncbi:hypothetical protein TNCV_242301 [Trichonephila clavipes]|uniref:Uncharacterized protein n=1 Tax=Trichonephila clavipes TaxID=2585209 RepID=A0A8X6W4D7_TRICX|nr:hypothetical protein TNCV_242301 [Trichonephila clavipes]
MVTLTMQREQQLSRCSCGAIYQRKCNQAIRHTIQPTKPSHSKDAINKALTHERCNNSHAGLNYGIVR